MTNRTYVDDNFGTYQIEDEDDVEFYHDVQSRSVVKTCARCERKVKILPDYAICNSCADRIERGGDY